MLKYKLISVLVVFNDNDYDADDECSPRERHILGCYNANMKSSRDFFQPRRDLLFGEPDGYNRAW